MREGAGQNHNRGVIRCAAFVASFAIMCALAAAQATAPSDQQFVQASEPRPRGILGYTVSTATDGQPLISVMEETSTTQPKVMVHSLAAGVADLEYIDTETDLRISWGHGVLSFRSGSGDYGILKIDGETKKIIADETSAALFDKFRKELVTVAAAVSDTESALSLGRPVRQQSGNPGGTTTPQIGGHPLEPIPDPYGGGGGSSCSGPWVTGSAYNFRKSMACADAQLDASNQCSNQWCWGCCGFLSCDCACLAGDFYCDCLDEGEACSADDGP